MRPTLRAASPVANSLFHRRGAATDWETLEVSPPGVNPERAFRVKTLTAPERRSDRQIGGRNNGRLALSILANVGGGPAIDGTFAGEKWHRRSEEHTSELQS